MSTIAVRRLETACPPSDGSCPPDGGFTAALLSGGDERIALGPVGVNRYLCPPYPCPEVICLSSCTASPISERSAQAARALFEAIGRPGRDARAVEAVLSRQKARLAKALGIEGLAEIVICPSGTDALAAVAALLAAERPGMQITMILPDAAETGSGVPAALAASSIWTAEPRDVSNIPAAQFHVVLRDADGEPRPSDMISREFGRAVVGSRGRPVVLLTHGTKTGLVAPAELPRGEDVIVDACQARLLPDAIRAYLRRGWPVVITGSKFYGGPAFSGAALVPSARWSAANRGESELTRRKRRPGCNEIAGPNLGMMLRWEAALVEIEDFVAGGAVSATTVQARAASVPDRLADSDHFRLVGGLGAWGMAWSDQPTIFTFAVRDGRDRERWLSAQDLRPLYRAVARAGVLLGQPVDLGPFGGLRIAVGARDARDPAFADRLGQAVDALVWAVRRPEPAWCTV